MSILCLPRCCQMTVCSRALSDCADRQAGQSVNCLPSRIQKHVQCIRLNIDVAEHSHLLMTLSRIRSTRRSLASLCSGVRQRSASMSGVGRAEGCCSACSDNLSLEFAPHSSDSLSQDNYINTTINSKYRNDMWQSEKHKLNNHEIVSSN